ncbi:uncharacterized [Tachysurus ichikawai]
MYVTEDAILCTFFRALYDSLWSEELHLDSKAFSGFGCSYSLGTVKKRTFLQYTMNKTPSAGHCICTNPHIPTLLFHTDRRTSKMKITVLTTDQNHFQHSVLVGQKPFSPQKVVKLG